MDRDLHAFDEALDELLVAHREAKSALDRRVPKSADARPADTPVLRSPLLHPEVFHELNESSEPLARALLPWVEVLLTSAGRGKTPHGWPSSGRRCDRHRSSTSRRRFERWCAG